MGLRRQLPTPRTLFRSPSPPPKRPNLPNNILRKIASGLSPENKVSLALVSRNTRRAIQPNMNANKEKLMRIKMFETLLGLEVFAFERANTAENKLKAVKEFIRLSKEYTKTFPNSRPSNARGILGSAYYKNFAKRFENQLHRTSLRGLHWIPFGSHRNNPQYFYFSARNVNGKHYKFYPYQTRRGTLVNVTNGKTYPKARNTFNFLPHVTG